MRLRADFWVAAYLRRCNGAGASAVLQRRGNAEAGAIYILIDHLDGRLVLLGPAPAGATPEEGVERLFARQHNDAIIDAETARDRLEKALKFDPDIWIIEVEDRAGRSFVDMA